ncbi:MAG: PilZ domain-containing protein, partial [Deltaproteobacteria bacterium]|nr:PilZ domain-containing protein [Deltaproteobacteria bacterium]
MKERRQHIRHKSKIPVDFIVKGRPYLGVIINLSRNGAFIETRGTFSIGDTVTLSYQSGVSISGTVKVTGKIVEITRITLKGIGVQFM